MKKEGNEKKVMDQTKNNQQKHNGNRTRKDQERDK